MLLLHPLNLCRVLEVGHLKAMLSNIRIVLDGGRLCWLESTISDRGDNFVVA
jgi:hypothetical protein